MLGRQRRDVAALALRERHARIRTELANARLGRAKARFLANPLNLLLPFTAGTLGGALALHRRPATARGERRREAISWSSLLQTATALWGMSLPYREALLEAREARATASAEPEKRPQQPTSTSADPSPATRRPVPPPSGPPPSVPPVSPVQPVPPA